jgi:acyl-CoA synthetase (AMP-forming)/AMP-acid ligase II
MNSLMDWVRRRPADTSLTGERSAAQVSAEVTALAESLPVSRGETIGLQLPNGEPWIVGFLALLAAGARPLLISADAPRQEAGRLMTAAGASRRLEHDGTFRLTGSPAGPATAGEPGVLLATSGSTGAPKLALRDEQSLIDEGLRYREAAGLDGTDRLVVPLPLSHAYALGWLSAALVTGTQITPLPPTSLSAIGTELSDGATIIALTPALARLLVQRHRRKPAAAPKLRLAMIGAGPVDEQLEAGFQAAFGISTGRNYGSTETGAMFAGLTDLPPLCVGWPMPGVRFRIVDEHPEGARECPVGETGLLEVSAGPATGPWRRCHDLAVADETGLVRILGRRHTAIRHGDRWVSPAEVEAVLREHPRVRDAQVRAGSSRSGGGDVLIADVELAPGPDPVDEATLRDFARRRLSGYKIPERIHLHPSLPRNAVGKATSLTSRYRLTAGPEIMAAMRAYRHSELLFALADLGLIERLADGADADELAGARNLDLGSLRWLLDTGVGLGLLETGGSGRDDPDEGGQPAAAGWPDLLQLEAELSATWLTRRAIADAVSAGPDARPFDTADLSPRLPAVYQAGMHGPHTAARTRLGLRLAGRSAARVLEVSAGPGRYLAAVLDQHPDTASGHLLPVGRLAGSPLPVVAAAEKAGRVTVGSQPPARAFDLCVVANAVHGPGPATDPAWLLDRLAPGGVLLIDDLFLPEDGEGIELGLDWLTHGGMAWPRLADLQAAIAAAGGAVARTVRLTPPGCCLIVAREEE